MPRATPAAVNVMKEATSRDFKGGLNVADSQLNLSSKFARELKNMIVGIDGSLQVRQGTRLFGNIEELTDYNIVDERYYAGTIISVDTIGQVFATDGTGLSTRIWDALIATHRRSGLSIWGDTSYIAFEEFGGNLIFGNGSDKPLFVDPSLTVDYLADVATGSNVNVPISKIVTKHAKHLVWTVSSTLVVSDRDAAGTYFGDSGATYVGTFDIASYVTTGSTEIIGLVSFKGFLLVMFQECIVPVVFTETITTPILLQVTASPDSIIANYGSVSHRTIQDLGDLTLALDIVGIDSIALTKFTKILSPDRPSRFVDPLIQKAIGKLDKMTLAKKAFALYDRRQSTYMMFMPNMTWPSPTSSKGFAYRFIENLAINAWSTYDGWNWQCGTRSSEGRIFFTPINSRRIYVMGDQVSDPIGADFVGEQETFSDGTTFTDQTGLTPISNLATSGVPIKWAWELPWSDLKARANIKTLRYVTLDTEGNQEFDAQVFIDNYYEVIDGGETFSDGTLFTDNTGFIRNQPERTPVIQWPMIAKDAGGYGQAGFGPDLFGGGNNTGVEGNTFTPAKGRLLKLRFEGEAMGSLKFVAITLYYQVGGIMRYPNG